eukprot:CAMPEP_0184342792 /NCGR_PEP_ID=MMETSP1089-20130417/11374_1 /TAXON_ID=38269 ORGANISM="Gloeochaete wittrockiana, Strain SAG46.84" /NCGR_SAMPLE_ID=MMETSP1089 /ASSEMBLY_ACC=CAM_ASM_000445 /LENGTH=323 /DNA_ID=CAMNT_0026671809 /DNA_START=58 /DNA_END=1026 /DNA_ORIENTATION=-
MAKILPLLAFLAILVVCSNAKYIEFIATLTGQQEVPPVPTLAEGNGIFKLHIDDNNRLDYEVEMSGLTGVTAAHIHGNARVGANAAVVFELEVDSDSEISGSIELTQDQVTSLKRGLFYINVHTTANANGEIRGQIVTTHTVFQAALNGDNMVPPVQTPATGVAEIKIDYETKELTYEITHNVDGATVAHVHGPGTEAQNSAVLFELSSGKSPIKGTHVLTDAHLEILRDSLTYIVVHSNNSPDGEIRGQIVPNGEASIPSGWEWLITGALILVGLVVIATFVVVGAVVWKKRESIKKLFNKKSSATVLHDGISQDPLIETEV